MDTKREARYIIGKLNKITKFYYEMNYTTEFELSLQIYDDEARVWVEADLKGVHGMLYSFNLESADVSEYFKLFSALQAEIFQNPITPENYTTVTFRVSDRRRDIEEDVE